MPSYTVNGMLSVLVPFAYVMSNVFVRMTSLNTMSDRIEYSAVCSQPYSFPLASMLESIAYMPTRPFSDDSASSAMMASRPKPGPGPTASGPPRMSMLTSTSSSIACSSAEASASFISMRRP